MFSKWLLGWRDRPQARDDRLSALLQEWKGIEPRANFETAVWRRIRTVSVLESQGQSLVDILRDCILPHPVWVNALAAMAAIMVGVLAGFSVPSARDGRQTAEPLLHSQTLAGSYLAMASGDTR